MVRCDVERTELVGADFEDGQRGPPAKKCRQFPESGKGEETDSP